MADVPFPISADDLEAMRGQIYEIFRQLYEEKIGGADLGDVFAITGDVLTLVLADDSGLTKEDSELSIDIDSDGGMQATSDGLSMKLVSTGGLQSTSSGTSVKLKTDGGIASSADGLYVSTPSGGATTDYAYFLSMVM